MSNALAIGAVTAVLRDLLNNGLIDHDIPAAVGDVAVSALPPDRVVSSSNGEDPNQLNLFLHRVTPNVGWRNANLPTFDQNGRRVSNTPLGLDLHYLLTAYGSEDFHAEILLGYAMQLMHDTPVLRRDAIRRALEAPSPVGGDYVAAHLPGSLRRRARGPSRADQALPRVPGHRGDLQAVDRLPERLPTYGCLPGHRGPYREPASHPCPPSRYSGVARKTGERT